MIGAQGLAPGYEYDADKTIFLDRLYNFWAKGCPEHLFTRRLYEGLHLHMGFIACHNREGFYRSYFADTRSRINFLKALLPHGWYPFSGPWGDVRRRASEWAERQLPKARAQLSIEIEMHERAELARLTAKYGQSTGEPS